MRLGLLPARLLWRAWCVVVLSLQLWPALAVHSTKFYDVLGVRPDASDQDIKKAYRQGALKWHPDRNPENADKAKQKFTEIGAAYEVLADPEKRQMYDRYGEQALEGGGGPGGGGGGGFPGGGQHMRFHFDDADTIFKQFFGGDAGGGSGFRIEFGGSSFGGGGGGRRRQKDPHEAYKEDAHVVVLDANGFPTQNTPYLYLLHFYSGGPGGVSAELVRAVQAVAKDVAQDRLFKVGVFNCDDDERFCREQLGEGAALPAIRAFIPGEEQLRAHAPLRKAPSAEALKKWAFEQLPNHVQPIKSRKDLDKLLARCGSAAGGGALAADWNLCIVLLDNTNVVSDLFKALSTQFREHIAMGHISRASKELAQLFGGETGSSGGGGAMFMVCNGDLQTRQRYSGKVKASQLRSTFMTHKGGNKCREKLVFKSVDDLKSLKVGQLRALMKDRGLSCAHCIEKPDFVSFLADQLIHSEL